MDTYCESCTGNNQDCINNSIACPKTDTGYTELHLQQHEFANDEFWRRMNESSGTDKLPF